MLKQRILTALILIPIALGILFFTSPMVFALLTMFLTLAAAWEWTYLMQLQSTAGRLLYLIVILLILFNLALISIPTIFAIATVWWLFAFTLILMYPQATAWWRSSRIIRGVMGLLVLVPCWVAINDIRIQGDGIYALLFLFILIWGADSAAYFAGKKWGRTKLAPLVSPGKSWQGLAGSICFLCIFVPLAFWYAQIPLGMWKYGLMLTLITLLISIVGDLFESMLKREAGLKDSGKLLPGHGGILDRIDSLTAAAPVYALGAILLGNYLAN